MDLDFFYDFVCPYAYLASEEVESLAARAGARLRWRPFLLGGVFRALGIAADPNVTLSPARARYDLLDLERWAEHRGVPFRMPAAHPRRTVLALRAALAAGAPDLPRASHALFRAYWAEGNDLEDPAVVAAALAGAGLDGPALVAAAPSRRDDLRLRTDEAAAAGVFGAPAFVAGGRLYWGQDRMHFVERALAAGTPAGTARSDP